MPKKARDRVADGPLIGVHVSISGGVDRAPTRGAELGCRCIQIFTKSNRQWAARPLTETEVDDFHARCEETGIAPVIAHDCYLINLCAPDPEIFKKSFTAFAIELERAERLRLPGLVMHPGSHLGKGEAAGLKRITRSLNDVLDRAGDSATRILLETTAGQGTNLGYRFEQLAEIMAGVRAKERIGVCFDTCHAFSAGYDLRTEESCRRVFEEFDDVIGLEHLRAFHFNDAKGELGSRLDRHTHIGEGQLGEEAFRFILQEKRFEAIPKLLETPKGKRGKRDWDEINLERLRELAAAGSTP